MKKKFEQTPIIFVGIFSSDEQNSEKKLSNFIEKVSSNEVRVIIGTQIASKGYDFANLKLVCIVDLILKNDEIDFKNLLIYN